MRQKENWIIQFVVTKTPLFAWCVTKKCDTAKQKLDFHCQFHLVPLREKCPNTELFMVRIFPHLDYIWRDTSYLSLSTSLSFRISPYAVRIWTLFASCTLFVLMFHDCITYGINMTILWWMGVAKSRYQIISFSWAFLSMVSPWSVSNIYNTSSWI